MPRFADGRVRAVVESTRNAYTCPEKIPSWGMALTAARLGGISLRVLSTPHRTLGVLCKADLEGFRMRRLARLRRRVQLPHRRRKCGGLRADLHHLAQEHDVRR